ncbi:type II toxin-antitoxin system PemK/MazF family toxin [Aminiphilus circumscriptus]|jgi:mRNA interferase MazF|uniref:type II toxin-antitoxin system PemK/MazF family toxin n=1 Tax=Aminiphilus circumscriptus TaxID=290732 RepID=UPI0004BBF382|nr:type II toxin-antitoxin system PemK/MazF family toxin [Aminiphilus circumscriptus]
MTDMGANSWIPDAGEVVFVNFNPVIGHEQASERPAVVLTPTSANRILNLCTVVPITKQAKGYPFEVLLDMMSGSVTGVALCDQLKTIDWKNRSARLAGRTTPETLEAIRALVKTLLVL